MISVFIVTCFVANYVFAYIFSTIINIDFVKRPRDMVALKYGPLFFAVSIKENKVMHEYTTSNGVVRKFPYCDYEIYPVSDWNYAFMKDSKFEIIKNGKKICRHTTLT